MSKKDLELICDVFLAPLRAQNALTREDEAALFSNIEMLRGIHRRLVDMLKAHAHPTPPGAASVSSEAGVEHMLQAVVETQQLQPTVAQAAVAFEKLSPFFKVYSQYCSDFTAAQQRLDALLSEAPAATSLLATALGQLQSSSHLQLGNLLIKPVQRLCKYPLLFRELTDALPPSHSAHPILSRARAAVEEVAVAVNARVGAIEGLAALRRLATWLNAPHLITPTRRLMLSVECTLAETEGEVPLGGHRAARLWLCNDIALLGTVRRSSAEAAEGILSGGPLRGGSSGGTSTPRDVEGRWETESRRERDATRSACLICLSPLHLASLELVGIGADGGHLLKLMIEASTSKRPPRPPPGSDDLPPDRLPPQRGMHRGPQVDTAPPTKAAPTDQRSEGSATYERYQLRVPSSRSASEVLTRFAELQLQDSESREQQAKASSLRRQQDPALGKLSSLRRERRHGERTSLTSALARNTQLREDSDQRPQSVSDLHLDGSSSQRFGCPSGRGEDDWLVMAHHHAERPPSSSRSSSGSSPPTSIGSAPLASIRRLSAARSWPHRSRP